RVREGQRGAAGDRLVRAARRRDLGPGAPCAARPQRERGEGARRHAARVDPAARSRLRGTSPAIPLPRRADRPRGGSARGGGRQRPDFAPAEHRLAPGGAVVMDWLKRESAPLSARAWQAIDETVMRSAKQELAARRVADFEGPKG